MEYAIAGAGYLAKGALGALGVGGIQRAMKYFEGEATDIYGSRWEKQMNMNQIKKLAAKSVAKTSKRRPKGCTAKRRVKMKYYKKRNSRRKKAAKKTKRKYKSKRK